MAFKTDFFTEACSDFKRDFYFLLLSAMQQHNVVFLYGPRHCGKTYALRQCEHELSAAKYINAKDLNDDHDAMMQLLSDIQYDRLQDKAITYLIDEVTYFNSPETFVSKIYEIFNFTDGDNTHIIITGSQSIALRAWEGKYFCGCCGIVEADFLNYAEWLRYKSLAEPTEQNYIQFLLEISSFYKFPTLQAYLEGCLNETVHSNYKAYSAIRNNSAEHLTVDTLLDILFCSLVNIHIGASYTSFVKRAQLESIIQNHYAKFCSEDVSARIAEVISLRYMNIKGIPNNDLRDALVFLYRNGLVGFTWKSTHLTHARIDADLMSNSFPDFSRDDSGKYMNYKNELFSYLGVYIKHPMFFVALLQMILQDKMTADIPKALLGDIVECHVRSLLPKDFQYTYHEPVSDREIDYVNESYQLAVEITVSDKHGTCFALLPDGYTNILLSKTKYDISQSFRRIPYYVYIKYIAEHNDDPCALNLG